MADTAAPRGLIVKCLDIVEVLVAWAAGLGLLVVVATIFFNATGRYVTGWSFLGGEELARLITVWITFLAAFVMVRRTGHVSIDLALRVVPPGLQRLFRGAVGVIGVFTMSVLTVLAYKLSAFSFGTGQMGTTLPVPRGLFFLPVVIGSALMAVGFLEIVVRSITNTLPPLPSLTGETDPPADGTR